jgi:hypothetical protein
MGLSDLAVALRTKSSQASGPRQAQWFLSFCPRLNILLPMVLFSVFFLVWRDGKWRPPKKSLNRGGVNGIYI